MSCRQYDRAVLSLGNVTNSGDTATPASDSMVFVEWDVIVVNIVGANDTANNDSFHWVSAGAAYNHDEEVWVGQTSFVTLPGLPNVSMQHFHISTNFFLCLITLLNTRTRARTHARAHTHAHTYIYLLTYLLNHSCAYWPRQYFYTYVGLQPA